MAAAKQEPGDHYMRLVNLTPHEINIIARDGSAVSIPLTAPATRCEESRSEFGTMTDEVGHSIRIIELRRGQVYDLPPVTLGVRYIVSAVVALAQPDRTDLLVVDEIVRNGDGRVVGCRALAYLAAAR